MRKWSRRSPWAFMFRDFIGAPRQGAAFFLALRPGVVSQVRCAGWFFGVDLRDFPAKQRPCQRASDTTEIAARCKITCDGKAWVVPSQAGRGSYRVTIGSEPTCECEDFQLRKQPCKHILAARLVCARDHGGKDPSIVVDAVPKRPTYKQDWPAYNLAQQTEKRRFQVLLADLCRGVPQLPQ